MGNLSNYNFNKIDAFLSNSEYYDFYLAQDGDSGHNMYDIAGSGTCFVVHYDFNENAIYATGSTSADTIYSLVTWTGATNSGYTFNTFGLTGIDNGYITYNHLTGDTANTALVSGMTGTTIIIASGDTRLTLNRVTGATQTYEYPIEIITDTTSVGDYSRFCGGFYQGYYKLDGYSYEVLPTRVPKGWAAEFWLRKSDEVCSGTTGTTLNDTYPDNKGFFFYMGTRAENKYWNIFNGVNTGCTSDCISDSGCTGTVTTNCTILKETDISIAGDMGYPIRLSPPPLEIDVITNPFLIYGRSTEGNKKCGACGDPSGFGSKLAYDFAGGSITVTGWTQEITNTENPFLIYGRATKGVKCRSCGASSGLGDETVCAFSGFTKPLEELDRDADIIDNAIGFRIKDDGSIGYRALKVTAFCENEITVTGVTVEEQYSASGMVQDGAWEHITVRFSMPEYDECELKSKGPRKGRLLFYVDCLLKFVAEDVDEVIARRLTDYKDKQLGVPFNFSLGGGSQGLLESMTFDGQDPDDLGVAIETNYAGTFIGDISQFKFYLCDLSWCDLKDHCAEESPRYEGTAIIPSPVDTDYLFYGSYSGTSISASTVTGMTSQVVTSGSGFGITAPAAPGYIYVTIPSGLSQPSDFRDSTTGCNNFNIPMITQGTVIIPDANGYDVTYTVYRTVNNINGELDIWLCN